MLTAVIKFSFTVLAALAGISFGWWLNGVRHKPMTAYDNNTEGADRAAEVLAGLQNLATSMASNVGQHSSRVQEINRQLMSSGQDGPDAVVKAVAKLLAANQQMQQQLTEAEGRLQDQAAKMETYAAEARTDPLTRLPNRRAFDAEINRQMIECQQVGQTLSIVMLDVDHFKRFNDTYGHHAGDEVLRNVADVLRRSVGRQAMVARLGGEEFVVLLPATVAATAHGRVERIRTAIEESRAQFGGNELQVTVSLGLAEWNGSETASQLSERADAALYAAKDAGRNRAYWHDGQTSRPIPVGGAAQAPSPQTDLQHPNGPAAASIGGKPATEASPAVVEEENHSRDPGGIPNRMFFCTQLRHRLAEWRRGGQAPSVLLVRVDEFDRIAATYGPRAGKMILEATAKFLNAAVREMDLVASMDAQLFAVLLPGAALGCTINIAERLRQAVAGCTLTGDTGPLRFTVSIGGAEADRHDDTAQLLRRAEEALMASSKSGGNCGYFHNGQWSETVAAARERLQMA